MRKRFGVLILALILSLSSYAGLYAAEEVKTPDQLITEAKATIKEVSVEDVKKMMDNKEEVIFLDVRDKEEYEKSRLPGVIHMSRGLLDFRVHEIIPDKNAKIVVICMSDKRSPLAARSMNVLGYKNAVNMKGGMKAWKAAGYPFEK